MEWYNVDVVRKCFIHFQGIFEKSGFMPSVLTNLILEYSDWNFAIQRGTPRKVWISDLGIAITSLKENRAKFAWSIRQPDAPWRVYFKNPRNFVHSPCKVEESSINHDLLIEFPCLYVNANVLRTRSAQQSTFGEFVAMFIFHIQENFELSKEQGSVSTQTEFLMLLSCARQLETLAVLVLKQSCLVFNDQWVAKVDKHCPTCECFSQRYHDHY